MTAPARSEDALAGLRFEVPVGPQPYLEPVPSPETDFWWRGEEDGILRLQTCRACGYLSHPPGPVCGRCRSTDVGPAPVSGRGTLWAWSVSVQPFVPGVPPYCVAIVQLEEQDDVRLTTQLVDVAIEEIRVDMPVEVIFGQGAGGVRLPLFRPVR